MTRQLPPALHVWLHAVDAYKDLKKIPKGGYWQIPAKGTKAYKDIRKIYLKMLA